MSESSLAARFPSPDLRAALSELPAEQRDFARALAALALERRGIESFSPIAMGHENAQASAVGAPAARAATERDEALLRDADAARAEDSAWCAQEAFQRNRPETARFFLANFEFKERQEPENGAENGVGENSALRSDSRSRHAAAFTDIAAAALEKTTLADWIAAPSGQAPALLNLVGPIWERCDAEETLAHALHHLARAAAFDRRDGNAALADQAPAAFERVIAWAWKKPISEMSESAVHRLLARGAQGPVFFLLENGAPVGLKAWQALGGFQCFGVERPNAAQKAEQDDLFDAFVRATRPQGQKPSYLSDLYVSAFSREHDRFLSKLIAKWPPAPREAYALLHFFARHETTIEDGEMFHWQSAHVADYGEYRGPDDWLIDRLAHIEAFDLPAHNAMGFLFETAIDHNAEKTAATLLGLGAPAAGFAGSGLPLAEHLRREKWALAEELAARGGWGPDGEQRILAMKFGPQSQRGADFAKGGWGGRARASFDARELAREVNAMEAAADSSASEEAPDGASSKPALRL